MAIKNQLKQLIKQIIREAVQQKQSETISDGSGSEVSYVTDGDVARIWNAKSVPPQQGFFTNAIKELSRRGFKSIIINIQSSNMREVLRRLVKKGVLKNPRDYVGISVDEHPSTFDIVSESQGIFNNQVSNSTQCSGYSHGAVADPYQYITTRDPLNDPILTGKLDETQYKFNDFKYLAPTAGNGFGYPSDVYYGTIHLGTIVNYEDGVIISTIVGPEITTSFKQSPRNKFKTQQQAAETMHRVWSSMRKGNDLRNP